MQHAVGSPLPPPHRPGQGPHAGWASAAHPHPGPHPGAVPVPAPPGFPATAGAVPPTPPQPPAPQPPVVHPPAPQHTAAPPAPETTGHVPLPPGGPVGVPMAPPAHAAVPDPTTTTLAVLLIGPAGAGKTSVAKFWADHRRVPTAHISLDDVREWVRSGFADPQSGWNDNSEAQYRLARRTCGFAARNFLANGISCILDDAVFPDRPVVGLGGWKRHVGPGLLPVVLLPGLDIVLERNAERCGNRRLTDEEVARIHGRMAGWYGSGLPIIDNSQLDVPGTARVLDEVLARAIASPPSW
ncbi:Pro-rich N-terminal domain-containing protein [Streptomyces monashensis]|uniref:Pro-rich N-terminal domain-containing protein n=1 Tax=Streptomyces monashensis TaxID=1678012 RepID=UPI0033D92B0C